MPENRPRLALGDVTLEDVEIGSAYRGGVDSGDDIGGSQDCGIRDYFPGALARTAVDNSFHVLASFSRAWPGTFSTKRFRVIFGIQSLDLVFVITRNLRSE
jgi:hypothetical protein